MRPFRHLVFLGPICAFGGLFRFIFYGEHNRGYEYYFKLDLTV
jgi:hypothetical protein